MTDTTNTVSTENQTSTDTTTSLTLASPVPTSSAQTLSEIATTIQNSPIANSNFQNLAKVAADVASTTAAGMSGNPVAITTTSLNLFADFMKMGPDVIDAWNHFISLFHKKAKS
jgi:hypothetical protein